MVSQKPRLYGHPSLAPRHRSVLRLTVETAALSYKYWAFISYSHQDKEVADWLHHALETYRVPRRLVGRPSRDGAVPPRLFPVFRDREELPGSASLGDSITGALAASRYLVVVCSPRSAVSRWVNEEVKAFKVLGREDRILCLIVDGEPNAADKPEAGLLECFPETVRHRVEADGRVSAERIEPIAADLRSSGDGRANARLKVLAGVLGVGFDELAQRERQRARRRRRLQAAGAAGIAAALAAAYVLVADGGLRMPGGDWIRATLDRHERSVLRPAHSTRQIANGAGMLEGRLIAQVFEKEQQGQFGRPPDYDMWSVTQALTAIMHAPQVPAADIDQAATVLAETFKGDAGIRSLTRMHSAPTLWTVAALANFLGRPGTIPAAERARYEAMLQRAMETATVFYPVDDGGWNLFPRQVDPGLHTDYSSALALLMLLDLRAAGLGWQGSEARRDAMIGKSVAWLIAQRVPHKTQPGWIGARGMETQVPFEGLSLQVYATLMRAHLEAKTGLPAGYLDDVYAFLRGTVNRPFNPNHVAGVFQIPVLGPTGRRADSTTTYFPVRFLWYPWSIACATEWLTLAPAAEVDAARITQVRRVLGYLVMDLQTTAIEESRREWPWVTSEMLYAVSAIPPTR